LKQIDTRPALADVSGNRYRAIAFSLKNKPQEVFRNNDISKHLEDSLPSQHKPTRFDVS
jgi:hypothetical protein